MYKNICYLTSVPGEYRRWRGGARARAAAAGRRSWGTRLTAATPAQDPQIFLYQSNIFVVDVKMLLHQILCCGVFHQPRVQLKV